MITARKQRLNGKRKVVEDASLITTVRILNDVKEAEAKTRERDVKKQKKSKKWGSKVISKESNDESEEDLNSDGHGGLGSIYGYEFQNFFHLNVTYINIIFSTFRL